LTIRAEERDRAVVHMTAEWATARKDIQQLAAELGAAEAERRRLAAELDALTVRPIGMIAGRQQ
jgi:hypothetical protein